MEKRITINQFRNNIKGLPSDEPQPDRNVYYLTQKEHWLCWLLTYNTAGAYGRKPGMNRDAKYAYNHIVCPGLLLYLIKSIKIESDLILAAEKANESGKTLMQIAGDIRKIVPWSTVYEAMYGDDETPGLFDPNEKPFFSKLKFRLQSLSNFLYKSR